MTSIKLYFSHHKEILFILLIASVLRIYGLFNLQYTFDELSALNRLEFPTFMDVIKKGIMIDAHPALIQVFLYYYCQIFGTTEWVVKLPFIIAGIASVYIVFDIGNRWFTKTTGLIAATLIACSQFFVMYSTIARPYGSGILLSLLALKFWLEIIFGNSPQKKQFIYFSIFTALSALNHHFSMMFVAFCGIIGLCYISKSRLKNYLLACLASIILYAPHFPVLLAQLKIGGIGAETGGWLDPPSNDFILRFMFYVFHFSILFIVTIISIIFYASVLNKPKADEPIETPKHKVRWLLLILFIINFLIGFLYSQKVNPVIQFSTLIFVAPCLILFIASFAKELNSTKQLVCILLLFTAGISTLIVKRNHYELLMNQSFNNYIKTADRTSKEKGVDNVYSIFKGEEWFLNFYKEKYHSNSRYEVILDESKNSMDFKKLYDTLQSTYLITGDFNPTQLLQASLYYPYIEQKITGYTYELYTLSKIKTALTFQSEKTLFTKTNFNNEINGFNYSKENVSHQGNYHEYRIDSLTEYPLSYKIKNTDLHVKEGQWIIAEITINTDKLIKGLLCASTDANGKNNHWTASELDAFYVPTKHEQKIVVSVYVSARFNNPENELTFFIWNDHKEHFTVTSFSIYTWNNNPMRYGLLANF